MGFETRCFDLEIPSPENISLFEMCSYSKQVALHGCVDIKYFGATGIQLYNKKVWSSHIHITHISLVFNSTLTPVGSHRLNTAAYQVCSGRASSGVWRGPGQCARAALQWEGWHVGITTRSASKTHSSYKLGHDRIVSYKHQDRNRSLLSSKDSSRRQGLFQRREGTLITFIC